MMIEDMLLMCLIFWKITPQVDGYEGGRKALIVFCEQRKRVVVFLRQRSTRVAVF